MQPPIVVAGAGILGASIALELARRGRPVLILDRREAGAGATGTTLGAINASAATSPEYYRLRRYALEAWRRAFVPPTFGARVFCETTEDGAAALRERVLRLQGWGHPARELGRDELRAIEPEVDADRVVAAELREAEGWVDAAAATRAMLAGAVALGAEYRPGCEVIDFRSAGAGVTEVVTAGGETLACSAVVLACGADSTAIAAKLGVALPQRECPGVVVELAPPRPLLRRLLGIGVPWVGASILLIQRPDGTLVACEGDHASADASPAYAAAFVERVAQLLPGVAGAKATVSQPTLRPWPRDGMPVIGHVLSNVYAVLTHSGVTLAPLIGELVSLELVDGARVELLDRFRPRA